MGNEQHYTEDSIVNKKKERVDELIKAHWEYQKNVISKGQNKTQTFTWDQVMEMREWDYTSSAKHFYGHGYEDKTNDDRRYSGQPNSILMNSCTGNCGNCQCD